MNTRIGTLLLAVFLTVGCGEFSSTQTELSQNTESLSMSVVVDGLDRQIQVFHPPSMTAGHAAEFAGLLIKRNRLSPRWLEARVDIDDWLAQAEATGPDTGILIDDVCIHFGGDTDVCGRLTVTSSESSNNESAVDSDTEADEETPKVQERELPDTED